MISASEGEPEIMKKRTSSLAWYRAIESYPTDAPFFIQISFLAQNGVPTDTRNGGELRAKTWFGLRRRERIAE
jgi:hypothetical protein